jgi:hypothetical protein
LAFFLINMKPGHFIWRVCVYFESGPIPFSGPWGQIQSRRKPAQ